MGNQFNWDFDEEDDHDSVHADRTHRSKNAFWFWGLTAVFLTIFIGAWFFIQRQDRQASNARIESVQTILDQEYHAYREGNGPVFFSLLANDPAWFSAQLRFENQTFYRDEIPKITEAAHHENFIWASARWSDAAGTWQRVLFFEQLGSSWVHMPSDPSYWGNQLTQKNSWGTLRYHVVDDPLAGSIANFVDEVVAEVCASDCIDTELPFVLDIRPDFTQTAVSTLIHIPSPRLIGLDDQGRPSPQFWQQLRQGIEERLTPTTIRFALPPPRTVPCCQALDFESAAAEFMRQSPHIQVELVTLDTLPADLSTLAAEYDGAAVPPTIDMVAAGKVYDLTDFAGSDPDFVASDFYEQIWQGTQWRKRMWFMPTTAEFNLIYYDKEAYTLAGVPEPNLFWQWQDMNANGQTLLAAQPEYSSFVWQFLDISQDALFAYAYSLADNCPETAVPPCLHPLQPTHIDGTLAWYKDLVQRDQIPDLTQQSDDGRVRIMDNFQSAQRHALAWVDEPITYEYYQLLDHVGVVPFPGVDSVEGVTPLWVDGAFISAESKRPYAAWQWLKFLSHQPPVSSYRLVPARPSVASETAYWRSLPRPLVDPMRTAYTFSRPVTLPEKRYFDWSQLAQVITNTLTPGESAQQPPPINWFGQLEN